MRARARGRCVDTRISSSTAAGCNLASRDLSLRRAAVFRLLLHVAVSLQVVPVLPSAPGLCPSSRRRLPGSAWIGGILLGSILAAAAADATVGPRELAARRPSRWHSRGASGLGGAVATAGRSTLDSAPVSTEFPRRAAGASDQMNIHVAAAASPRFIEGRSAQRSKSTARDREGSFLSLKSWFSGWLAEDHDLGSRTTGLLLRFLLVP